MAKITRKLYALATELNLVERGNPEDDFHIIVFRVTGKQCQQLKEAGIYPRKENQKNKKKRCKNI